METAERRWKTISSRLALDEPWFQVRRDTVRLPSGKILDDYFVWVSGDIVLIVALTAENKIVLVRQYKHATDKVMIELPTGFADGNEDPEKAAGRELVEETGYMGKKLELLAELSDNPTKQVGTTSVWLAKNVEPESATNLDENEDIEVLLVELPKAVQMVLRGEIWATSSVAGILMAWEKLHQEANY